MSKLDNWVPIAKDYNPLMAGSIDGTDSKPHDHGVIRAMQAAYYPNKKVVGDAKFTIFVSRLNPNTTEGVIRKTFSQFGEIRRCRLVQDLVTGFSKGYAFVEYEEERSAYRACRDATKMILEGSEIFVDYECERTMKGWIPRRLGGGLGGKKESGQLRFGGKDRPFRKPILLPPMRKDGGFRKRWADHEQERYRTGRDGERRGRHMNDDRSEKRSRYSDRWEQESYGRGKFGGNKFDEDRFT